MTDHNSKKYWLLHARADRRTLDFFLQYFFLIWFVHYLIDPLQTLGELPTAYADPVGPLRWIPAPILESLLSRGGLTVLRFSLLLCCLGVLFKPTRSNCALFGCVLLTMAAAIPRSFGHINHAELGPILVTWVLTLFHLKMPVEGENRADENSCATAGLVSATLLLSLVYAFVGIARITQGGWQLFFGDTIPYHVSQGSYSDWVLPFDFAPLVLSHPWMVWSLKLGTLFVTILEIATPFALVSRRVRLAILLVMPMFHLGAIFLFKVIFIEQPLSMLLFVSMTPVLQRWHQTRKQSDHTSSLAIT